MSEEREIALVIGTAGHIDHGKTTLISSLTGVNCDRLNEEKKRGITIELGFAPLRLDDGRVISVIDVPGHERFIRQMVAGASGIDAVLLIVAADESIMPQTREHLAILELLGIKEGLVAITKIDRVEPGMAELVEEDVRDLVKGTFLDGKPIIPVSGVTGENLDLLKKELKSLTDRTRPRPRKGALFLPIDRAFPMSGFGTVITGTAYRGIAKTGDEVKIFPSGKEGRVRSLQVHGKPVDAAFAGQRVAMNLSGISVDEISRGEAVCHKGVYSTTRCFDAVLKLLPNVAEPLKHWQRVRLYVGTSDVLARVALLTSKQLEPGSEAPVQIVTEEDIICVLEERFIIRFYSPLITLGGGRVIFPYSHKPRGSLARASTLARIEKLSSAVSAEDRLHLWVDEMQMADLHQAAAAMQESPEELSVIASRVIKQGYMFELKGERPVYISRSYSMELEASALSELSDYHAKFSSEAGMPLDELARRLRISDIKTVRSLAAFLLERGAVALDDNRLRKVDFVPKNEGEFKKNSDALMAFCLERGWQLATLEEVRTAIKLDVKSFSVLIQSLKSSKSIVILEGEFVLTAEMEKNMLEILQKTGEQVTLASIRDATGSSRKFILPVLEYFDSKGYTRRVGDVRVVKGR